MGFFGVLAMVIGLAGPVSAQLPPGPPDPIPPWLADILDQLDAIEGKVDALPGALGPCEVPPVWGQTYATADRFVPVLGGAAFCDKATGLVWDGSPSLSLQANWQSAITHCGTRTVGGHKGFHLPMLEQLTSLLPLLAMDLNSATGDGPFSNVQSAGYWSASADASNPAHAWIVSFVNGNVISFLKSFSLHAWCVRGGQVYDGQDVQEVIDALP
jgi:hypothetical protein